jgi:hypothetical protein
MAPRNFSKDKTMAIKIFLITLMLFASGCAAQYGIEKTGTLPGYDVYTARSQDKMGINTASTFLLDQKDGKLAYGNTAAQPGIGKDMVEQIIPAVSNASIGTFTGVFFPKPGSTNVNAGNVGNMTQGQGQATQQGQGQVGIVK